MRTERARRIGYLTNPNDAVRLQTESYRAQVAQAIADAAMVRARADRGRDALTADDARTPPAVGALWDAGTAAAHQIEDAGSSGFEHAPLHAGASASPHGTFVRSHTRPHDRAALAAVATCRGIHRQ
jgi:hypothetical protein